MSRARLLLAVALTAAACSLATAAPATAAAGLSLGFMDDQHFFGAPATGALWLDQARGVDAQFVRMTLPWSQVAPQRPPAASAADPAWAGYRWSAMDDAVRATTTRGMRVLFTFATAPDWAEGPGRRAGLRPGVWKPDPAALGAFATAAARRYSGASVDGMGAALPQVRAWQAWNEPNLSLYLAPQWSHAGGRLTPASPRWYRRMLNAVYAGVHAAQPGSTVVSAGTAPYGDVPGGARMMPALFTRELLCLRGKALRRMPCADPAHLDALDHHPYSISGPQRHAINADDVGIPDLAKLTRPLRAAERSGRVLPAGPKELWITEFSWDSGPPDPHGVPLARHALWLEEALYLLWNQGARVVMWLGIADQSPVPSYDASYQSGVFFKDGRPKPAATAYRFPFVTSCAHDARCVIWGRSPQGPAPVVVERRTGSRWTPVRTLRAGRDGVFRATIALGSRPTALRARAGTETSLPWRRR